MATRRQVVTSVPTNLVTEQNLSQGDRILIQNIGQTPVLIAEAAAAPDPTASPLPPRAKLLPNDNDGRTVGTNGIWVWARHGSSELTIDEEG